MILNNIRSTITNLRKPGKFFYDNLYHAKVVSIDIFNTILLRKISPEIVIKRSSQRFSDICSSHDQNLSWLSVYEYRRIIKERLKLLNNYKGHDPDCRFADIVDLLSQRFIAGSKEKAQLKQEIYKVELEEEFATLTPGPEIIFFLNKIKKLGKIIVFLSDMYLSANDIFYFLESFSLNRYFETGFTSGDQLLTKQSGRLYQFLLEELKVSPDQVVHIGDHFIGDYQTPKALGIRAFLYLNFRQKFRIHRQRYFLPYTYRHFPVTHYLQKNKDVRREILENLNTIHFNTAKFVIAPVFLAFVENILRSVRKESVEKIYFLARDGFIFYKYYKALCSYWGFDHLIDKAEYVFFSRVTLSLPSTKDIWEDGLREEGWKLRLGGLSAYFRGFGISSTVIDYFCKKHRLDPYKKRKLKNILSGRVLTLARDHEFIQFVHKEKSRQTKLLESYLTQIGFFGASRVLFVDIGWHGTISDRLYTLFSYRKDCPSIRFEYLGFIGKTYERRKKQTNESAEIIQKGFYFDSVKRPLDPLNNLCSGAVIRILENCCRTFHGSVIGYESKMSGAENHIVPVLGPSLGKMHASDIRQIDYFRSYITGLKEGFNEWAPAIWEENSAGFKQRINLAEKILIKMLSNPSLEEAASFLSIPYQQDGGINATQTLQGISLKMLFEGNRSTWIPGNLNWYGLNVLNSVYLNLWKFYKMFLRLRMHIKS